MPTDPVTLPGDIPGLLRRCSPVRADVSGVIVVDGVVRHMRADGRAVVATDSRVVPFDLGSLSLDLSDPTGQQHASAWAFEAGSLTDFDKVICAAAALGKLDAEGRGILRDIVLRLAGVTDAG